MSFGLQFDDWVIVNSQSKAEEMTWNHLVMYLCTSTWEVFLGKDSKLLQRNRNMKGLVKRRCLLLLKSYVKVFHVSHMT